MKKWTLIPKITVGDYAKLYPNIHKGAFRSWFRISRSWGGRIIQITIRTKFISLDFRRNWLKELIEP